MNRLKKLYSSRQIISIKLRDMLMSLLHKEKQEDVIVEMKQVDTTANPGPLGLMGFGMTTVLLNFHNVNPDALPFGSMILAMGLCYGGLAQVIAGILEFKKGNTFGTLAFTSYGFFWISLVVLKTFPLIWPEANLAPTTTSMGFYLSMWGILTAGLFVGTLKLNRALQVVFASLTILFALLAIKDFTGVAALGVAAGVVGIFTGFSAIYTSFAEVLNEVYGKVVLPIDVVKK